MDKKTINTKQINKKDSLFINNKQLLLDTISNYGVKYVVSNFVLSDDMICYVSTNDMSDTVDDFFITYDDILALQCNLRKKINDECTKA